MNDNTLDFFGFQHKEAEEEEVEQAAPEQEVETTEQQQEEEAEEAQELVEETEEESVEQEEAEEFSFAPVVEGLAESGILVYDPEKEYEDSEEGFQEVIADTVAAKLKEELQAIPEDYRSILAHLKAGKSLQEWVDRMDPTDFAAADLEDEQTQEILVREQFKAQGFSEAQIEKKVTKLKDSGLLDSEAEDAQEFLVEKQKKERASYEQQLAAEQEQAAKQQEEQSKRVLADIMALEEVDGIRPTKEQKQQLHAFFTKADKDGKTEFAKLLSNPERLFAMGLKEMLGVGKETYQRKATTQATGAIRKAMQKYTPKKTVSGKAVTTTITNTKRIPESGMPWS